MAAISSGGIGGRNHKYHPEWGEWSAKL